ncbi:chitinase-3-like protein 1 isoform X2 [Dermacentor albipictus]|uniref:chitinase-3-like protein 1 isoform X2 n=1 Tax=Dermacentor albipictus TaxID=60249 RepID=UPI0038FCF327
MAVGRWTRSEEMASTKEEPHRQPWVSRWLPAAGWRQYGLFLTVVSVTSLASAALLAFASMTHHEAHLHGFDNEGGKGAAEGQDESMAVIRKAFEESSMDQQDAPMKPSASSSVNLLCRFSVRYRLGIYPYGVCTHFIYASVPNRARLDDEDVLYSYDKEAFRKFLHVRELAPEARLLFSVELAAMLDTGWPAQRLASDARAWLGRGGVDGLHLAGLDLLPRNMPNITGIVTALRKSFKRQYLLSIGIDRSQRAVEKDLLKILKLVNFASFKTCHLRHTDDYTTLTNPYSKYDNSTAGEFLGNEVDKLAKLAARTPRSRLCFTLDLGGNQFLLQDAEHHGLGAPAKHIRDASYAEICRRKWTDVRYVESAMSFYARSGRTWIGYETEKTVAEKVQLALRRHPKFCVMLVQVDKDDLRGICSEKHFPLAQSVRHAMRLYGRRKMRGPETS